MTVVRAGKTRLEVTVAHAAHISCKFKWSINQQVSWMYNMMLINCIQNQTCLAYAGDTGHARRSRSIGVEVNVAAGAACQGLVV